MGDDNPEVSERANSSKCDLRKSPVFSAEDSDLDFGINKLEQQSKVQNKGRGKPREKSIVDEIFLQLSAMEAYLENRGKEEEQKDDDDESGKSSRNVKYKDFFDPVESDEDTASDHDDELGSNKMMKLLKKQQKN
ncbi:U3 small nucleolar ribonucleoprotein protein MPP10 [Theropithecus gelada]|uniref:U3 small nucleolar ribonucleoprotein protein MPP10 n=1 Tax=Theropithecus gelada TaxID=9565 RepID=UPI000DC1894F|nr:U3 small nucleolar ribonucleoprotein protein MPP10 [Theropithecus gelada]